MLNQLRTRLGLVLTIAMLSVLAGTGCSDSDKKTTSAGDSSKSLRKVRLQLNWFPEPEHGGFYAAKHYGYFAEEGLDVEIIPGAVGVQGINVVVGGGADFALANADQVLLARQQGAEVKTVFASLQHSPRCIMVHEESGIQSLQALENVTLAVNAGRPFVEYLKKKVPLKDVQVVAHSGRIASFLQDKKFAQQAYVFSEPIFAKRNGAKPRTLLLSEIGFDPYESCVVVTEGLLKEDAELVKKFVKATQRGWQKYFDECAETNIDINKLNSEMDVEGLKEAVEILRPLSLPTSESKLAIGEMEESRWEDLAKRLREIGLLEESTSAKGAFSNEFIR